MRVLLFLVPITVIVLFNYTTALLSGREYGRCMPISIIICMFIMYISQFAFNTFTVGIILILIISVAAIPLLFVFRKEIGPNLLPQGTWLFFGICIFVLIWDVGRHFTIFDEFYFWGPMIQESLRLDQFYSVTESKIMLHKDYPPFITLLEYMWCRLSGGYSESAASMAVHFMLLSVSALPLAGLLSKGNKTKPGRLLCGFCLSAVVLMVIFVLDPWIPRESTTILVDVLVAVLFAYSMYVVYRTDGNDWFGWVELIAINTAIIMIKQVGVGFLMVTTFYAIITCIIRKKESEAELRKDLTKSLAGFFAPLTVFASWTLYVRSLGISGQFDLGNISIKEFINAATGKTAGLQHDTIINYGLALFQKQISSSWIPITFVSALLLLLLALLVFGIIYRNRLSSKEFFSLGVSFICCSTGYAFVMALLYAFCFNEYEMVNLSSFERYMSSFVLGEMLTLLFIVVDLFTKEEKNANIIRRVVLFIAIIAILLAPGNLLYLAPQGIMPNKFADEEKEAEFITNHTEQGDKVLAVYDSAKTYPYWYDGHRFILLYYSPERDYPFCMDIYNADLNNTNVKEEVVKELSSADYIYIKDLNPQVKAFLDGFLINETVKEGAIYDTKKEGNNLILEECE